MALIKCPKCGKMFSEHADKCPVCNLFVSDFQAYNLQKHHEDRDARLKLEELAKQQEEVIKQLKEEKALKAVPSNKKNKVYLYSSIGLLIACLCFFLYWNKSKNSYSSQYDFSQYDKPSGCIAEEAAYYDSNYQFCANFIEKYDDIVGQYKLPSTSICYHENDGSEYGKYQIWSGDKILFEIIMKKNDVVKLSTFENLKDSLSNYPNFPIFTYEGIAAEGEGGYRGIWEGIACYFKFNDKKHYLSEKRNYRSYSYYEYEEYDIDGNVINKGSNR